MIYNEAESRYYNNEKKKIHGGIMKKNKLLKKISFGLAVVMFAALACPSTVSADTIHKKPGVEYHTKTEIAEFIKTHNAEAAYNTVYKVTPRAQYPYEIGELSSETLNGATNLLNTYRYIAGIPSNVSLDANDSRLAQAATLVNAANNYLTHYPSKPADMSDDMYALGQEGARSSNLAAGYNTLGYSLAAGWMSDGDSSNIDRIGHRRWVLNPTMGKVGFGKTQSYTAMYVFDRTYSEGSKFTGVAWPAQNMPIGYFNSKDPWSLSVGKQVTDARVLLKSETTGQVWTFSKDSSNGYFNINNDGYGQTGCIIFRPDSGISVTAGNKYSVQIVGKTRVPAGWRLVDDKWVNGEEETEEFEYTYEVEFFDPNNIKEELPPADKEKVQAFVKRLYQTCLGREPENEGFEYWTNKLVSREADGASAGAEFVFSKEYLDKNTPNIEYLTMLYRVFMNREPEEGGINYWKNEMINGATREKVFKGFIDSKEYTEICKNYGIEKGNYEIKGITDPDYKNKPISDSMKAFVERLYVKALGRQSEPEGMAYWCKELSEGWCTPTQAAEKFIISPEFEQKKLNNEEYVKVLYATFLNREAEHAGLQYWLDKIGKGETKSQILEEFAQSAEFQKIVSSFGL